jgi:hypothetical protein
MFLWISVDNSCCDLEPQVADSFMEAEQYRPAPKALGNSMVSASLRDPIAMVKSLGDTEVSHLSVCRQSSLCLFPEKLHGDAGIYRRRNRRRAAFGEMVTYLKAHPSIRVMLVEKTDRLPQPQSCEFAAAYSLSNFNCAGIEKPSFSCSVEETRA